MYSKPITPRNRGSPLLCYRNSFEKARLKSRRRNSPSLIGNAKKREPYGFFTVTMNKGRYIITAPILLVPLLSALSWCRASSIQPQLNRLRVTPETQCLGPTVSPTYVEAEHEKASSYDEPRSQDEDWEPVEHLEPSQP
jgi:hypothetical protein